jgi:hypothetical protein
LRVEVRVSIWRVGERGGRGGKGEGGRQRGREREIEMGGKKGGRGRGGRENPRDRIRVITRRESAD